MTGKVAEAGVKEWISDFVWDDDNGPLENILRWANRLLIVFSGGPIGLVAIALTAAGMDFSRFGRMMDEKFNLRTIDDLTNLDQKRVSDEMSSVLMGELQGELKRSDFLPPLYKKADEPDGTSTRVERRRRERAKEDAATQRVKELQLAREQRDRIHQDQQEERRLKREEAVEKDRIRRLERQEDIARRDLERGEAQGLKREELKAREEALAKAQEEKRLDREHRERVRQEDRTHQERRETKMERQKDRTERRREKHQIRMERVRARNQARGMMSSGKMTRGALGFGIGGILGWVIKSLTDRGSFLSRALRGAGVVGAEGFAEQRRDGQDERRRSSPPLKRAPTTNLKVRLERKVDEILQ